MVKLQIIVGSTRQGRVGKSVAEWAEKIAENRSDIEVELVDIMDFDLPIFNEALPPAAAPSDNEQVKQWAAKIGEADGYLFVVPEYNHGIPGGLKNAVDYLAAEWADKAAVFVGYGYSGGVRSVEQLRNVLSNLNVAHPSEHVELSLVHDFESHSIFKPQQHREGELNRAIDRLVKWADAMKAVRSS